jgi:hypothetical protein
MSDFILVKPSVMPPDLDGSCIVVLRAGSSVWSKTYPSTLEAGIELVSLKLATQTASKAEMLAAQVNRTLASEAEIHPHDLMTHGFRRSDN